MNFSSPFRRGHLQSLLHRLLENGIFWMVLVLLSIGAITTYYHQDASVSKANSGGILAQEEKTPSTDGSRRQTQLPILSAATSQMQAAITFDVAGSGESIPVILDILDKYHIKATFFVSGTWVNVHPESVRSIALAGHEIGSSGKDGKPMKDLSEKKILEDMQETAAEINALTGQTPSCFRPPAGEYDDVLLEAAQKQNTSVVLWNINSEDWKDYGAADIAATVLEHEDLGKGSILLFHTGAKYTPSALAPVISGLQSKGLELTTLSELIQPE